MTTGSPPHNITPAISIYIRLAQYPVLADKIHARMRQELFQRGVIDETTFEAQVREEAIESQHRERLSDPYGQEEAHLWQKRLARVRDFHTDAIFADNLGIVLFDKIIQDVLRSQPSSSPSFGLNFNPELAPWEVLFRQGEIYERLPEAEFERWQHHLEEIKVVPVSYTHLDVYKRQVYSVSPR